nr:flagellar FlbD family protein [Tepidanaerobacter acetatoxydans]
MIKIKPGNGVSNNMIELTRLNGTKFVLNAELIETVESTPDTVITLITDKKLVVLEKKDEIINKVIKYKKHIFLQ